MLKLLLRNLLRTLLMMNVSISFLRSGMVKLREIRRITRGKPMNYWKKRLSSSGLWNKSRP